MKARVLKRDRVTSKLAYIVLGGDPEVAFIANNWLHAQWVAARARLKGVKGVRLVKSFMFTSMVDWVVYCHSKAESGESAPTGDAKA